MHRVPGWRRRSSDFRLIDRGVLLTAASSDFRLIDRGVLLTAARTA